MYTCYICTPYFLQPHPLDLEVMTPLTGYIVYYGPEEMEEELSFSEVVENGTATEVTILGITTGGAMVVGVAAVNSAGPSEVAYYQHRVGKCVIFTIFTYYSLSQIPNNYEVMH